MVHPFRFEKYNTLRKMLKCYFILGKRAYRLGMGDSLYLRNIISVIHKTLAIFFSFLKTYYFRRAIWVNWLVNPCESLSNIFFFQKKKKPENKLFFEERQTDSQVGCLNIRIWNQNMNSTVDVIRFSKCRDVDMRAREFFRIPNKMAGVSRRRKKKHNTQLVNRNTHEIHTVDAVRDTKEKKVPYTILFFFSCIFLQCWTDINYFPM